MPTPLPVARTFTVTVRSATAPYTYTAISTDSAAAHMAAVDRFGVCAITVTPAGRAA